MAIFIPPSLRQSKKCQRCGLRYPLKAEQCVHCKDLSERQVAELKIKVEMQQRAYKNLGKLFFYIAVLIFVAMLLLSG
jgi:hypothetical protein